ncbi:E3 ubiquitin-protein ligase PRT6-like [Rutidosis leptorrhynchoides]|uniref:E3 ubiquitin-protein ligase PRT6-like n=1 Tax=Rutidosis leptorrhynchoides TaxID=125765 RepID=UPI003A997862
MNDMEIDSSSSSSSEPNLHYLSPKDRILKRLVLINVPEEYLEHLQLGIITYIKEHKSRLQHVVNAILPTDTEMEAAMKPQANPTIEDILHESMVWLQWLMFEGDPSHVLQRLAFMNIGQRGVCGSVWGNNDIAYRCRTCEHDPTCAICVPCFQNGNHKDHDYSIIYTGGGCCDCGDVTAWKRTGFCSKHKGAEQIQPLQEDVAKILGPVLDCLLVWWNKKLIYAESMHQIEPSTDDTAAQPKKVADVVPSTVVGLLLEFGKCSESLLSFVSGRLCMIDDLLEFLVMAEMFLVPEVRKLQELLLKWLSDPFFKYEFAKAFLNYYPMVINEAVKECKDSVFRKYSLLPTFSVQIFTVPTLTPRLVKEMDLLAILLQCLCSIISCCSQDNRLLVSKWGNLYETTHRVVEDIRFVMSHSTIPKYMTSERRDISRKWMKLLAFVQGMSPQKRETNIHIEEENENMHLPFVFGHSIANIHALLVAGAFSTEDESSSSMNKQDFDEQDGVRHAKVGRLSQESSVSGVNARGISSNNADSDAVLASISWLMFECLKAIGGWLKVDNTSGALFSPFNSRSTNASGSNFFHLKRKLSKFRKGKAISASFGAHQRLNGSNDIISAGSGDHPLEGEDHANELEVLKLADWPKFEYDVSSQEISVHIPLHRLLSLVLQKALKRFYGDSSTKYGDFFGQLLAGCHPHGFSAFVMEHPLRIRVFCSQVHAGMWRKNGDAAILSYEWYRSVRWSEQGLELDLFLLQCCAALAPPDLYIARIIERFGLSTYLSLNLERDDEYEAVLVQEMLNLIIQIVKERRFCGLTKAQCLQRELVYKLSTGNATHSQLVKSLPRDLSKVDQFHQILDTVAEYSYPSGIKQGMYKLRLEYWKELDLYHPRWNSRDLQVAEERYLRFCQVSALTNQLPKWTKIYPPLNGLAKLATCKTVLQLIRAVLFYALFTDKLMTSRAPDGVLITALHLLSLALDICQVQIESGDTDNDNSIPLLAFAGEEVSAGLYNGYDNQSLLSLLVSLMRINQKENVYDSVENGGFDLSFLIKGLLQKFAKLDSGCLEKLLTLSPEVVNQLSGSKPTSDNNTDNNTSISDSDKRKAKARERQAAIMEKMKAQQSKFMESINSTIDTGLVDLNDVEENISDVANDLDEPEHVVCSLCHDASSKSPVSFLILLQKSKVVSLLDKGPPSWNKQVNRSGKEQVSTSEGTSNIESSSSSETITSSSDLMELVQNAINEFASTGQPNEVDAFLEFIKIRFPSLKHIHVPQTLHDNNQPTISLGDVIAFEENMYTQILDIMESDMLQPDVLTKADDFTAAGSSSHLSVNSNEPLLLGKYIASLSDEILNTPSPSETGGSRSKAQTSSVNSQLPYDGFGPSDCNGIYVSSCGHAVHQVCLDRYLRSLKERYTRRLDFEGGHIVDPDQGEFLCPVCRGLANSVLPDIPKEGMKGSGLSKSPSSFSSDTIDVFLLRQSLSLLHAAADVSRSELLKSFPVQRKGGIGTNLESAVRLLREMYFPENDKVSGSNRLRDSTIMWDTLKYSLISTEIAARSEKTSSATNFCTSALYEELRSSSGFILSLLLKIVNSIRSDIYLFIYFCLRTGYYDEARDVAFRSRVSHQFASQLAEWITNGGMVSGETASIAAGECEKMLRMGDRAGRGTFDKKKLLLYALISGSRRQIDRLLREQPTLFNTIEDFLWFKLCAVRDSNDRPNSVDLNEGLTPYNLDDLQAYLNKFEPSYYTKYGKDPLVYPYVLLLSIQLVPAVLYLSKDIGDDGYNIDAAHIAIVLADHGVLSNVGGTGHKLGVMDAFAEPASIIRQYGLLYLRHNNLSMALEYYAQAAITVGGGQVSWSGRGNVDQQRQRTLMMQQLLMEILLREGGIILLLGPRGAGEEGELGRFMNDRKERHQFLLEAARQCQEAGLNDKSIEIHKRIGAYSAALNTINMSLSEAICSLSRGRLDGESRTSGLVHSGNELLETFKYHQNVSLQEREHVLEQETLLRQLETILSIHKLARQDHYLDALRELAKLPFLPFDPRAPDTATDMFQNLSPYVQACVPDLLKVSLQCIDNVRDSDGSLRALKTKIANFLANNLNRNWPRDLYERVARTL